MQALNKKKRCLTVLVENMVANNVVPQIINPALLNVWRHRVYC